jgi:hypothetical protein
MKIQVETTIDISATGVTGHYKPSRIPFDDHCAARITNPAEWQRSRNQQRNWETITQLISLRTQVNALTVPNKIRECWQFEFEIDNPELFLQDLDPLGVLKNDCNIVPMMEGNSSTVLLKTQGPDQNIWFTIVPINKE